MLFLGRSLLLNFGRLELEVRSHVGDLDLDALTLVAVVVLPAALHELAGDEDPHPFLQPVRRVLGE
ncbi:MAG: hypothetical protein QOC87_761, partial [Actinomycetota bacterium]|nr:hypothetical protein [Actinomycetota bacterium]